MVRCTTPAPAITCPGGCASLSSDDALAAVGQLTQARTGQKPLDPSNPEQAETTRARLTALLASALSADGAVEVALLNKQNFRARIAELHIADADQDMPAVSPTQPCGSRV